MSTYVVGFEEIEKALKLKGRIDDITVRFSYRDMIVETDDDTELKRV